MPCLVFHGKMYFHLNGQRMNLFSRYLDQDYLEINNDDFLS